MEAMDVLIGLVPGIIIGAVLVFILRYGKKEAPAAKTVPMVERTILREELDKGKSDYKALKLEKELLAGALTRVFEAESKGKITKQERDMLTAKYREQIKQVDAKIGDLEVIVEVGELENLRSELVNLLETKVSQIERRLDDARNRLEQLRGPAPIIIQEGEKPAEQEEKKDKKVAKKEPAVDDKVKDIRNEVLEALARLEQMDVEG
jgi:gas vesicle protein